jgi:hypothetical protein
MNWIKIEDELPPIDKDIWVVAGGFVCKEYIKSYWKNNKEDYLKSRYITHWQFFIIPLPPIEIPPDLEVK